MNSEFKEISRRFQADANLQTAGFESLKLDGSWPSIAILENYLWFFSDERSGKGKLTELLPGAALYLAELVLPCWESFGATCKVLNDPQSGIVLQGFDGKVETKTPNYEVRLQELLLTILTSPPDPFPIFPGFSRDLAMVRGVLPLFCSGLMCGRSPLGTGSWLQLTAEVATVRAEEAVKSLARSTAEHYSRLFPEEQLGQVAELYLKGLIYPPQMMTEDLPAKSSVTDVLEFCRDYKVSPAAFSGLAQNLAQFADPQISDTGLAIYSALATIPVVPKLVGVAESKGSYLGLLREAMLGVRAKLGLRGDWIESDETTADDYARISIEKDMGIIPWVELSTSRFQSPGEVPKLRELLRALARFNLREANHHLQRLLEDNPVDLELRFLQVHLAILEGDMDLGNRLIRSLNTETVAENHYGLFHLSGMLDLARGDISSACTKLKQAFSTCEENEWRSKIVNDLAFALMLEDSLEEAQNLLIANGVEQSTSVTALLNLAFCLRGTGKSAEAGRVIAKLGGICPYDRRVFSALLISRLER